MENPQNQALTQHPILLSWFCALQSNTSYLAEQWQGTGSDFSDSFLQKAKILSNESAYLKSQNNISDNNPNKFDPNDPLQCFLLETFASAMLSPKNHSKTLLSLDKGIDRVQISSFNIGAQHIHLMSFRGTEANYLKDTKSALITYLTQKYTSFKHSAAALIPLTNELLRDPPISAPIMHSTHPLAHGSNNLLSPKESTLQIKGQKCPLNFDNEFDYLKQNLTTKPNTSLDLTNQQNETNKLNSTTSDVNSDPTTEIDNIAELAKLNDFSKNSSNENAPIVIFTGHSYGAALAHQMQKHYSKVLADQAIVKSIGFGSPGFGQSTLIQTSSPLLNSAQMVSRGAHNLILQGSAYVSLHGPLTAISALVHRFAKALKPSKEKTEIIEHKNLEQETFELLNSKKRLDFINKFDPVPIVGYLVGNKTNDRISLKKSFEGFFPGILGKNHKMSTYVHSLTQSVLMLYPPENLNLPSIVEDKPNISSKQVHLEAFFKSTKSSIHNQQSNLKKTPPTHLNEIYLEDKTDLNVEQNDVDMFLTHFYKQSVRVCLKAQQIQKESTADSLKTLQSLYPNEPPENLQQKAFDIGLNSMCAFARGMLLKSGISTQEKEQLNVPEEPNSYEDAVQMDFAQLHHEYTMRAAIKAFNMRRTLKDLTQPLQPIQPRISI